MLQEVESLTEEVEVKALTRFENAWVPCWILSSTSGEMFDSGITWSECCLWVGAARAKGARERAAVRRIMGVLAIILKWFGIM